MEVAELLKTWEPGHAPASDDEDDSDAATHSVSGAPHRQPSAAREWEAPSIDPPGPAGPSPPL